MQYLHLIQKWNRSVNLTAIDDLQQMIYRHVLDSLSLMPYLDATEILDVGSGAGLPGIPLALMSPRKHFTLLDSNSKKTRFLLQARINLELENVSIENCRVEHYASPGGLDIVLSRAFSSLAEFIDKAGHLCSGSGKLLAMKGQFPQQELDHIPPDFHVQDVVRLQVPGLDSERHLVIIGRKTGA